MTSVADVAANLAAARRLLALAREGGACLAVLPENFCFMGRNEAERRAIVERDGDGPIQQAVAAMAREFGLWVVAGTQPIALDGDSRPANACVVYDARGQARRALRQDPPVRRRPAGRPRGLSRIGECRAGCEAGHGGHAGRQARIDRVLRFALPRAVSPPASLREPKFSACPLHSPARPDARIGKCCCGPARRKTCLSSLPPPRAACTTATAKPTATA